MQVVADTPAYSALPERVDATAITRSLRVAVTPIVLYLFSTALLLIRIGGHPGYSYNWESYTSWEFFPFWDHPTRHIFGLTDGLMTDSGRSPLIIFPAWLGFQLGGAGLTSLRVPIALIAALAVPLLWLVTRHLTSPWTATLAAALLAVAPAFILYARTATLVGISVAPALLTVYALLHVLQRPFGWNWGWLIGLQALLIADSYAYAPIRFLWPMSVVLLLAEIIWRRGLRWRFVIACLVTAIVLPTVVIFIDREPGHNPRTAIKTYYNGRGEQILSLRKDPAGYKYYLHDSHEEAAAGDDSSAELAYLLIKQNMKDLAFLLLDHGRRPAITDYWNPHGRLYPWFLVPFFLIGMGASLRRLPKRVEDRLLLALFLGFSLPMIATSQVHIGRLIFAMPFLFVLVAGGITLAAGRLTALARRLSAGIDPRLIPLGLALTLFLLAGWSAWRDYRIAANPSREANIVAQLRAAAPDLRATHGSAALVTGGMNQLQIEEISASGFRLDLNGDYAFVNLAAGEHAPSNDPRPVLYYGALFDQLAAPSALPLPCDTLYYVDSSIEAEFIDNVAPSRSGCASPPRIVLLAG